MAPPQGAQPIIVCPVSGHAWRASGTRSNTERDCAVHPRRAAALAHRALVRRHLRRTRRGWATAHAPRGTLIRLPLAFLSGFVHLFVAEHVRRRWFLGVLVYLPAHFVDRVPLLAARVRSGVRHRCRSTQRLLVGHKVVFQYARSFAASCGFVQCPLENRCS